MLINLRNALMAGKRTPTARDYVQNGLVAMWDGIENSGWGVHNANPAAIADLVGDCDLNIIGDVGIGDNYFSPALCSGNTYDTLRSQASLPSLIRSFDIVLTDGKGNGNGTRIGIISFGNSDRGAVKYVEWFGAGVNSSYRMMPNGQSVASKCFSVNYNSDSNNTDVAFFINSQQWTGREINWSYSGFLAVSGTENLVRVQSSISNMSIFSIRLYSRIRTAQEIAANYAIDKARFGLP